MATLLLQTAGAAIGGLFGPFGAVLGRAVGALAGYAIDTALINSGQRVEGPRLTSARPITAEEGTALPRLYGTARLGGILIWATRFEEETTTRRTGAKGGPRQVEYDYFANVAFALCEGPIAGIRRAWADGRELDLTTIELRVHTGEADQQPDPLIEAKQGEGNAPAYRGTAYVVFERLALADFGNRIPQIQVEVLRPVGALRHAIRAVTLIPGSTEYGLDPSEVTKRIRAGETVSENRHVLHGATDLVASLDELQMLCPSLEHVGLVVSWFGNDLRAGSCRIRPAVTAAGFSGYSKPWLVSGVPRDEAMVVSTFGGGSAYGGTPSDASVLAAIAEIKARGLKVTLYPFLMMDIPASNDLPDPYGGGEQAAYPWRGRITCIPAPDRPGTPDRTAAARTAVEDFCGSAEPGDFEPEDRTIAYHGASGDWGYRRLILHYAHLARKAGGVDAFLIGSELRGLSTLRDGDDAFPFVEALCTLADEVKSLLGPDTAVTYGADWSEYFGYHPADGSGDVFYHLDALWARPSVAAVGIDNYMPLTDWRDADYLDGNPDGARGPLDPDAMRGAVAGGEGFDWYYASEADRAMRLRTPITDGAYGKPWVYRYKDIVSWWSQPHFERIGGVERESPTDWVPCGKPVWMTELGCPAVDKGANQPNVFVDPKSSESFTPHFSNDGRDDLAPKRFLAAHLAHWDPSSSSFDAAANPLSPFYGGRMLDPDRIYVWCWDARPFPAFPRRGDVWGDGGNWQLGHWLNGRLEGVELSDLINAILADHGLPPAETRAADGIVQGYVIDEPGSARGALEPLIDLYGIAAIERPEGLELRTARAAMQQAQAIEDLVVEEDGPAAERTRVPDHELPAEAVLVFRDHLADFQSVAARAVREVAAGRRQHVMGFPGVLEREHGRALIAAWLDRAWSERETVALALPPHAPEVEAGAVVTVPAFGPHHYLVTEVETGLVRRIRALRIDHAAPPAWAGKPLGATEAPVIHAGAPHVVFLDLPATGAAMAPQDQFRVAAWQKPWKRQVVLASADTTGFETRTVIASPADLGVLAEALPPGHFSGRVDRAAVLVVDLFDAEAASVGRLHLLGGANAAAIRSENGAWEIVQFELAEEIAAGRWRLSRLLRGQLGTEDAMVAGSPAGADFVMLNSRVAPAGLRSSESGLSLLWKVGRAGAAMGTDAFTTLTVAGGLRAMTPLAPAHLRMRRLDDGFRFTWIRRGRLDADAWEPMEIPLGEETEAYAVEVALPGGSAVRTATVSHPSWTYAAADMAADFGGMPAEIEVTVRQQGGLPGIPAIRRFAP